MSAHELATLFAQLADDELLERMSSGGLTEEAQSVAEAELQRRQISVPSIKVHTNSNASEYLGDLVELERSLEPTEAHMLCSYLQSAGIHADAGDANIVQAHGLLSIAVGGAKVRVPSSQLTEAKEALAAYRRGDFELPDDFDYGAPDA
jgi:hypothetical protein